jgi:hypothetical protein
LADRRDLRRVFGHALLERARRTNDDGEVPVWCGEEGADGISGPTAAAIADARWLTDPQELRPLPMSGIPGWHAPQDEAFYAGAECFRPARPGRRYPLPLPLASAR